MLNKISSLSDNRDGHYRLIINKSRKFFPAHMNTFKFAFYEIEIFEMI